jgi:hypothetical protein
MFVSYREGRLSAEAGGLNAMTPGTPRRGFWAPDLEINFRSGLGAAGVVAFR